MVRLLQGFTFGTLKKHPVDERKVKIYFSQYLSNSALFLEYIILYVVAYFMSYLQNAF